MNADKWVIVGGGLHGVHLAIRLIIKAGVAREKIQIIDPADTLLEQWSQRSAATGMKFLRSPSVHHLAPDPFSLVEYSGIKKRRERYSKRLFAPPFDRPSLRLFNEHCKALIEKYGLNECHVKERAVQITPDEEVVIVRTNGGMQIRAERLILALGVGENSVLPSWVPPNTQRVERLFDFQSTKQMREAQERLAIIGGGISAVQAALKAVHEGHKVTLVTRHQLRKHQFDSDPGWLGPKHMRGFARERSMARRRSVIRSARHRGSIPPELFADFHRAMRAGQVELYISEVENLIDEGTSLRLRLKGGACLSVERVILATGLEAQRPGGELIERLVSAEPLPCAGCGFPIVDRHLRWHPRIFVAGALAELELGPSARNISGARRAGERIIAFVRGVTNEQPSHVWHPKGRRRLKRSS